MSSAMQNLTNLFLGPFDRGNSKYERAPMETTGGESKEVKEGSNLLGPPTFEKIDNGRFRCKETGHELPSGAMDTYANSKCCRLGLIDFALTHRKPPLNMFKQDPVCRSKLICELTGDTINKSEEHIWKHINGKRFLNKLEQMEAGKLTGEETSEGKSKQEEKDEETDLILVKLDQKKKKKPKTDISMEESVTKVRESPDASDSEEPDFWEPPVGERWDFDNRRYRWDSDSDSGRENEEEHETDYVDEEMQKVSTELSKRTKRMSIEIGPSSFASRKKKTRTKAT